MSSNAAVGSQKPAPIGSGGSSSYGPIGSTTFSQAAPGPPFPSGNVNAQPQSKLTYYFNVLTVETDQQNLRLTNYHFTSLLQIFSQVCMYVHKYLSQSLRSDSHFEALNGSKT